MLGVARCFLDCYIAVVFTPLTALASVRCALDRLTRIDKKSVGFRYVMAILKRNIASVLVRPMLCFSRIRSTQPTITDVFDGIRVEVTLIS